MTHLGQDLRHAVRRLRHHAGYAATSIGVLAFASAITATALDVVGAYVWRPLPYPYPDRLAVVDFSSPNGPGVRRLREMDWRSLEQIAELAVTWDVDAFTVSGNGAPYAASGRWIGADIFAMFGIEPALGRFFTPEEARSGAPLAVLGYDLWQGRYGGDPSIIGRSVTVRATLREGEPQTFTIVGVLPRRFWHLDEQTNLLLSSGESSEPALLRLRRGVMPHEAAMRLTALVRAQAPDVAPGWRVTVTPAQEAHIERIRPMLSAMMLAVLLLAAVAFGNLAFLEMARGLSRQREFATRAALGAGSWPLIRQTLAEALVTGGCATVVGLLLAVALLKGGLSAVERYLGRLVPGGAASLGADPLVFAGVVAATVVASVILALLMFLASRCSLRTAFSDSTGAVTDSSARARARQVLVGAQVAVAFALLVAAALMIRTAWHLGRLNLGFEPAGVLTASLTLHEADYPSLAARRGFFRNLFEQLERIPGVTHVGATNWFPFQIGPTFAVEPDDGVPEVSIKASMQSVNSAYFTALRIRLVDGRVLTADDQPNRERVAVISRSLARGLWPGGSAVGRSFRVRFSSTPGRGVQPRFRVVGVVEDVVQSLTTATPPQMYTSFDQSVVASVAFLQLRSSVPPRELAPAVARIVSNGDPNLPLSRVDTLDAIVNAQIVRPQFLAQTLAGFAILAVSVSIVGLYAVSAWIAQRRRREAALRMALGANRETVALLLAKHGLLAIVCGLAAGWPVAGTITSLIAPELHGVNPSDVWTRVLVAGALAVVSAAALWRPVWAAATLNLSTVLRQD